MKDVSKYQTETLPGKLLAPSLICLVLLIAVALVYGRTVRYPFVSLDDPFYVAENPTVKKGLTGESLRYAATETGITDWLPVLWLSFMVDVELFGPDNPGAHHLVNVALHAANVIGLFLLLRGATGATARSALVAALFAVHPLHVESVAWISERKDVLSTLLWLGALWTWGRYARGARGGRPVWLWYLATAGLMVLGLMTKAMLVTLPVTLLLIDYWPLKRLGGQKLSWSTVKPLILEKLPLLAICLAVGVANIVITRTGPDLPEVPLLVRIGAMISAWGQYLVRMVWPANLAVWYPHPWLTAADSWGGMSVWGWPLVAGPILAAGTLLVWRYRQRGYLVAGWLWYLVVLLPVSGIVQFAEFHAADRYAYVPLMGVYIMVIWGAADAVRNWAVLRQAAVAATSLALVVLTAVSVRQVGTWQSSEALYRHALAVTKDNYLVHNNLGSVLIELGRFQEAGVHLQDALRVKPDYADAHTNLGIAYLRKGRPVDAVAHFQEALRIKPDFAPAHSNLGVVYAEKGELVDAIKHFERAVGLNPDFEEGRHNLRRAQALLRRKHGPTRPTALD